MVRFFKTEGTRPSCDPVRTRQAEVPLQKILCSILDVDQQLSGLEKVRDADMAEAIDRQLRQWLPLRHRISEAFRIFAESICNEQLEGRSPGQRKTWLRTRRIVVEDFIKVFGDVFIGDVTKQHALYYQRKWTDRIGGIEGKSYSVGTAARSIYVMRTLFRSYYDFFGQSGHLNPFDGIKFVIRKPRIIDAFPKSYIHWMLNDASALEKLNIEARMILFVMAETGCRPIELCNLVERDIVLDHHIPHIHIQPRSNYRLKTAESRRQIPLKGIALEIFTRLPNGFVRYYDNSNMLSNTISQHFSRYHELPLPSLRLYSLRHSFEARLLEAGIDYAMRGRLLGHIDTSGFRGRGNTLTSSAKALSKITMTFSPEVLSC